MLILTKFAQTLDGRIATASGKSKWITSPASRKFARKIRARFDAILVGTETVLRDDPLLDADPKRHPLIKIVADSRLRTPVSARLLRGLPERPVIFATTTAASQKKRKALEKKGAEVLQCRSHRRGISLKDLVRKLERKGIQSLLIEGGGRLVGSALDDGIVDRMHVYTAPMIMGCDEAKPSVSGMRCRSLHHMLRGNIVKTRRLGPDVWMEIHVHRNH